MATDELRDALSIVQNEGDPPGWVRAEIGASWRRSLTSGLQPDRFDVPFIDHFDDDSRLARAAGPVVDGLVADLDGSAVSVVLADAGGHLVRRWVLDPSLRPRLDRIRLAPGFVYAEDRIGTNAIGTALAQRRPSWVDGQEHFADAFTQMACAAAPLTDPQNGRPLGVIDLTCRSKDCSPLLLTLARRTAREIEDRLIDEAGVAERMALRRFLQIRRGAKGPIVFVDGRRVIANTAAEGLVSADDAAALWEQAARGVGAVTLAGGDRVRVIGCEPVVEGAPDQGVILRLERAGGERGHAGPPLGWDALTEAERSVAALVAEGLTNRQIGERLFVSRHTVDTYLRSIFRRLGIGSRVELARIVLLGDGSRGRVR